MDCKNHLENDKGSLSSILALIVTLALWVGLPLLRVRKSADAESRGQNNTNTAESARSNEDRGGWFLRLNDWLRSAQPAIGCFGMVSALGMLLVTAVYTTICFRTLEVMQDEHKAMQDAHKRAQVEYTDSITPVWDFHIDDNESLLTVIPLMDGVRVESVILFYSSKYIRNGGEFAYPYIARDSYPLYKLRLSLDVTICSAFCEGSWARDRAEIAEESRLPCCVCVTYARAGETRQDMLLCDIYYTADFRDWSKRSVVFHEVVFDRRLKDREDMDEILDLWSEVWFVPDEQ